MSDSKLFQTGSSGHFIITNFLSYLYLSFAGDRRQYSLNLCRQRARACLKNHSRNLHAPLCGRFHPNSVAVARYGALIRAKSPTNCDAHLAEILFQTRSSQIHINHKIYIIQRQYNCPKSI